MNDNELYAKALVDSGYATKYEFDHDQKRYMIKSNVNDDEWHPLFLFYSGEADGWTDSRRFGLGCMQAFALEDWIRLNYEDLWGLSKYECEHPYRWPTQEWRLSRIKYCFSQPEIVEALK